MRDTLRALKGLSGRIEQTRSLTLLGGGGDFAVFDWQERVGVVKQYQKRVKDEKGRNLLFLQNVSVTMNVEETLWRPKKMKN